VISDEVLLMQPTINIEALAERLATLRIQSKAIESQINKVTEELMLHMKPGTAVRTPEYSVTCQLGRSSFKWNSKKEKKAVEANALKQGMGDYIIGKNFIDCRFLKQADYAE
jgi:hypothetical protein